MGVEVGSPGVYFAPPVDQSTPATVRLDVAGFVGVAPRGPVDVPVPVTSWSDYQWIFGGTAGPGGLGDAVHAFFAQGGVRALVLRVSPLPRGSHQDPLGRARHRLVLGTTELAFAAADEGSWGDSLVITWEFVVSQSTRTEVGGRLVRLPPGARIPPGSLLRLWLDGGRTPVYRWAEELGTRDLGPGRRDPVLVLDRPTGAGPEPAEGRDWPTTVVVDVVTATVDVTDRSDELRRHERFADLGLAPAHPRHAATILADPSQSRLVRPAGPWPERVRPPEPRLSSATSELVAAGRDRWDGVARGSFLDDEPAELLPVGGVDPLDDGLDLHGVERISVEPEVGLLCVPDLLWDVVLVPGVTDRPHRPLYPEFAPCRPPEVTLPFTQQPPRVVRLAGGASSLAEALDRQRRVVVLAERQQRFVALLDVPDGLTERDVARWRASIDSSHAAAYHPWLASVPEDGTLRPLAPSAVAAGIIAARERRLGIPWGPANEVAVDAVRATRPVTDQEHARLHELDVNVFRAERDGFRLSTARTLSRDRSLSQLSVRRLMTMLRQSLARHGQRLAFEPSTAALRRELTWSITQLLRDLHRGGAFAGATEQESFFVRCDDTVNPAWSQEQGRLVAEVGVAPSYPLEFLVVRLVRDASGSLGVEG
nr:phage tail sheath subtilisin-like domain-containing protein [Nocardioides sp. zg-1230]